VADEPEVVTLIGEDGAERRFYLHDAFDTDGSTYYVVEATDDPEEVMLLKETGEGLESVDGEELDRVIDELESED
jgi:diaminopimelate decarboxylase